MKKIKELNIHVTFSVGLRDIEVPYKVYDQLLKAEKRGLSFNGNDIQFTDALDFLADEASLDNAYECEYEVEVDTDTEV